MSDRLVCVACGRSFDVAASAGERWVACPNCQASNVNPAVVHVPPADTAQVWAVLGVLIIVFSTLGLVCGPFSVAFAQGLGNRGENHPGGVVITFAGFLLLFVAGILLLVLGSRPRTELAKTASTLIGTTVLLLLLALSALVYGFSVCF